AAFLLPQLVPCCVLPLPVATAAILCVSTLFPVVAGLSKNTGASPKWWGSAHETTAAIPHHFGKAPVFLDNPATTGNTVDTQKMAAVATASGRLQRGTGCVPRTAASGIVRCWVGPLDIA